MLEPKRIGALDIGERRIGVAISDPMFWTAQAYGTVDAVDEQKAFEEIREIIKEKNIFRLVLGLPKNMNNTLGPSAQKVLMWKERLEGIENLELILQDERLSTVSANRVLMESGVRRENRKHVVDQIAASYILQTYLDRGVK